MFAKRGRIILLVAAGLTVLLCGGAVYARLGGGGGPVTGAIDLQKGLMGWWKLDGNGKDATPYANNGTVSATSTTDRRGKAAGAMAFNGSNQQVQIANSSSVNVTGDITVSAWVYHTSASAGAIMHKDGQYTLYLSGNQLTWADSTVWSYATFGYHGNVPLNTWSHIVATKQGSTVTIYLNGAVVISKAFGGTIAGNTNPLYLGSYAGSQSFFAGSLDDERLYNRALSTDEVQALYATYDGGLRAGSGQEGLVGWWKFDGNTKDATPYGNATTLLDSTLAADRNGAANRALRVNGTSGSYASVTIGAAQRPATAFSYSVWANKRGPGSNSPRGLIVSSSGTYIDECYNGSVLFSLTLNIGQKLISGGTCPTASSGWHHYAATYDGSIAKLYVDGVVVGSLATSGNIAYSGTPLNIGRYDGGSYTFNGDIDDVRLYNRALTQAEVQQQYQSYDSQINLNTSPSAVQNNINAGLTGSWPFNGNAKDTTPFGRNGTLFGNTTLAANRYGEASRAYAFDGSGDYIDMGSGTLSGSNDFSMAAWVKSTQLTAYSGAIASGVSAGAQSAYIGTVAGAQVGTSNSLGGGFYGFNIGSGLGVINQWAHVALTYGSGSVKLYINGTLTNTATYTPSLSPGVLRVGRIGTDTIYDFKGSIDDVRLYNRVLSAVEVQALYQDR